MVLMQVREATLRIQRAYPRIYHACHTRHQNSRTTTEQLSPRDSSLLAHLSDTTPTPHSELAHHLGLAKSTCTEALQWLEQCGYVQRVTPDGDARGAAWLLTAAGLEAMSNTSVLEAARLATVLDRLSPADRERAVAGLELLAEATR
jgi:MarR family transcriptional regulator, organic hydroperoxide resistance regulator